MHAAGIRKGDVVINTFAYHLTPGGFILDAGARALGCPVIPAGPGNKEAQLELIEHYRPRAYVGTPDFLKILLDAGRELGRDTNSIEVALVTGAALPASLRAELEGRGVKVRQCYAIADVGLVAYETDAPDGTPNPGMVVDERIVLEIVRPGTSDRVAPGEVGEIVVSPRRRRPSGDPPRHRRPLGADARALALRPDRPAHPRLDGPRRPEGQGQGHVRRSVGHRPGGQTPPRDPPSPASSSPRDKEQDAMELRIETEVEETTLLTRGRLDAPGGDQAQGRRHPRRPRRPAARRQGHRRRAAGRLIRGRSVRPHPPVG